MNVVSKRGKEWQRVNRILIGFRVNKYSTIAFEPITPILNTSLFEMRRRLILRRSTGEKTCPQPTALAGAGLVWDASEAMAHRCLLNSLSRAELVH